MMKMEIKSVLSVLFAFNDYLHAYLRQLFALRLKHFNGSAFVYSLQVWGAKEGPYEFKPVPASISNDMFSPLNFHTQQSMEKRIEGSLVLQD